MPDDPIKGRSSRAKRKAAADLRDMGYFVINASDRNASLIGFRKTDIRIIRVVLDRITPFDRIALKAIPFPNSSCSRELWLRKFRCVSFEKCKT